MESTNSGRYGYLPATATAIVLTACLLATLAFAIRTEDSPAEAAPLVNTSALRADDDCPCRRGALVGGAPVGPADHSTKNVVAVTKRNAESEQHRHRVGSNGKSSAAHPPMPKAKAHSTPSESVGRVVPGNAALYAVGDHSPPSRVPEETTRPEKRKVTTGSERGQAIHGRPDLTCYSFAVAFLVVTVVSMVLFASRHRRRLLNEESLVADSEDRDGAKGERAELESFYRLGQVTERNEDDPEDTQDCCELMYDQLSEENAALLRRMLSTGPPVRSLNLCRISISALKVAFHGLEECPRLEELSFRLHSLTLRCQNTGAGYAKEVASYIRQGKYLTELSLYNSCGGDEGVAVLIEALTKNETLKKFSLDDMKLSSDTLITFAKMLASNTTLEVVDIREVCPVDNDKVLSLLEQERYSNVFKRLQIVWPEELLPELTALIRRQAYGPRLSVTVTSSVDEGVLGKFFDAVAADKALRGLSLLPQQHTFEALANGIASLVKRTTTLREIWDLHFVEKGNEHLLIGILDALKENRSISQFTMYAQVMTPELATSLSGLLAANNSLNVVRVCNDWVLSPKELEIVLQGMRVNYTVNAIRISFRPDDSEGTFEMEAILDRNCSSLAQGCGKGVDALKKLRSSADLVEKVQKLTGKTEEAATEAIQSALARISA
ncbi:hypothetical protein HPB52_019056 [Rhipicephalus sanguineus]|uniref:Uncharacterized protein n=1 Tax=Rhipicephalus sanguineus TaxID=34632 RepID=A0A9D4PX89_RHISA|nr:hypothetical protein HPB52_019056 [Rhipicephalus sanguineus]